MPRRAPNPRLVKINLSYTVEEVASLLQSHRNTVRNWIKNGLRTCDDRRPTLILGRHLAEYLTAHRARNKRACKPGEIYCLRCRAPRTPAGGMADFQTITVMVGNLIGICPECSLMMNRRVSVSKLEAVRGHLDIKFPLGFRHIGETQRPTLNCELRQEGADHDKSQPQ